MLAVWRCVSARDILYTLTSPAVELNNAGLSMECYKVHFIIGEYAVIMISMHKAASKSVNFALYETEST